MLPLVVKAIRSGKIELTGFERLVFEAGRLTGPSDIFLKLLTDQRKTLSKSMIGANSGKAARLLGGIKTIDKIVRLYKDLHGISKITR